MADTITTAVADLAVKKMVSKGFEVMNYVMDLDSELKDLENTRTLVEAALLDSDSLSEHHSSHTEKDTLEKLSCQLDRLLDLFDARASRELQKQVMSGGNFAKELRSFFSASNQLVARFKDARKVADIKKKLNSIAIDHAMIGRICSLPTQERSIQTAQSSHVVSNLVVGRNREKDEIVSILFEESAVVASQTLSVASIVGIGGIGKTTMAWYAYNDERMKRCFDVKFWVSATQDFDIEKVLVEMITACGAGELPHKLCTVDQLYHHFRRAISGKKFLLVLDNIWDHVSLRQKWVDLRDLLSAHSAGGSRVLITTRDQKVARIMGTVNPYVLGDLVEDDSWLLFQKIAFTQWQEPGVEAIGKEIAEMCPKVPLVIRSIGGLLAGKHTVQQWQAFRNDQLANFASYGRDIMHTLKFSYDQLDARLKLCVTYCILFPKATYFEVGELIHYWIALGYVKPQYSNQSLEEAGQEYLINLINCGFFTCHGFLEWEDMLVHRIVMHDVMYELVLSIAGFKYKVADSNTYEIDKRVRHLSFWRLMKSSNWQMPSSLPKIKHLQSFIIGIPTSAFASSNFSIIDKLISTYEGLKVLDLQEMWIEKLPESVGELIRLRYLNLSRAQIVKLPNSITRLVNLQSLYLKHCFSLEELPRDMSKLLNLRHLLLVGSTRLRHMPMGLGNLTNLTILDVFIVGEQTESEVNIIMGRLSDLSRLNNLRGELHIEVRRESKYILSSEISEVNLEMKESLLYLIISFKNGTKEDERVLECLQPPSNLEALKINGYGGERLPGWMEDHQLEGHLPNLEELTFKYFKACKNLCSLGRLPCLEILKLENLDEVEYMDDNTSIVDELPPASLFPSLHKFTIKGMPKLKGWWRMLSSNEQDSRGDLQVQQHLVKWKPPFPKLALLQVDNVELAITITRQLHSGCFTSLKRLCIENYDIGEQPHQQQEAPTLQNKYLFFPNLKFLNLWQVNEVEILSESFRLYSTLERITISKGKKLKAIPEWIDNLTSLKALFLLRCPRLESLPQQIANLPNLDTLRIHTCPILWERCQSPNGEYWPLIQHIPHLYIDE
ncbi:disease resistance protein RGA2-like [Chenopodium quinoa]|uniref:NB-ARC domain-containing protein n=1 Tax=Chenopodium quinoa TaxID=63459 RepID=A0A803L2I7_CHEQI|nr:disease resistance protein RGA2-like [Chenopodium quinoa]